MDLLRFDYGVRKSTADPMCRKATGIFTRLLLTEAKLVYAAEPNPDDGRILALPGNAQGFTQS